MVRWKKMRVFRGYFLGWQVVFNFNLIFGYVVMVQGRGKENKKNTESEFESVLDYRYLNGRQIEQAVLLPHLETAKKSQR